MQTIPIEDIIMSQPKGVITLPKKYAIQSASWRADRCGYALMGVRLRLNPSVHSPIRYDPIPMKKLMNFLHSIKRKAKSFAVRAS